MANKVWVRKSPIIKTGNRFYNVSTSKNNMLSECIYGVPSRSGANVLCNCTGFANGAFCETYIKTKYGTDESKWPTKKSQLFPFKFKNNACFFIDAIRIQAGHKPKDYPSKYISSGLDNWGNSSIKSLYDYILPATAYPPLGGLIIWGSSKGVKDKPNPNHVAFISNVKDKDNITILQAGYGTPAWSAPVSGGYRCGQRDVNRNDGGKDIWWYQNLPMNRSNVKCLGFIANPAIGIECPKGTVVEWDDGTESEIEIQQTHRPQDYPSSVTKITQTSSTSVSISVKLNGIKDTTKKVKCYYKWGKNVSSKSGGYDGTFEVSKDGTHSITKPREATYISVLPVQINSKSVGNYEGSIKGQDLTPSYPCVGIQTKDGYKESIPNVYSNGKWNTAVPNVRKNKKWNALYNTDTEIK